MAAILESPNRPELRDQTAFNLAVWEKVLSDPFYNTLEHRIETDKFGQIIMSPPPSSQHGECQFNIGFLLKSLMQDGHIITECPISTSKGVRAADTIWISKKRKTSSLKDQIYTQAPEICVEVISPSNTPAEMAEKKALYFQAGADEVWFCEEDLTMKFFSASAPTTETKSQLCPDFPLVIAID